MPAPDFTSVPLPLMNALSAKVSVEPKSVLIVLAPAARVRFIEPVLVTLVEVFVKVPAIVTFAALVRFIIVVGLAKVMILLIADVLLLVGPQRKDEFGSPLLNAIELMVSGALM